MGVHWYSIELGGRGKAVPSTLHGRIVEGKWGKKEKRKGKQFQKSINSAADIELCKFSC
jgi:hypothetical protein